MNTIKIVFVNKQNRQITGKSYWFLNDYPDLKINDIISSPDYKGLMRVIWIENSARPTRDGHVLKVLNIKRINKRPVHLTSEDNKKLDILELQAHIYIDDYINTYTNHESILVVTIGNVSYTYGSHINKDKFFKLLKTHEFSYHHIYITARAKKTGEAMLRLYKLTSG